jgi:hypothetical protein
MSGEPLIDENATLLMLRQPVTMDTLPYIQSAALQVLVDLYDRKVTRENFGLYAGRCVGLYATLAKLAVLANTRYFLDQDKLTAENIDASAEKLIEASTKMTSQVEKTLALLMECPTPQDPVN